MLAVITLSEPVSAQQPQITAVNPHSGFIFEHLGKSVNHVDDWSFVDFYDLRQVEKQIESLRNYTSHVEDFKPKKRETDLRNVRKIINNMLTLTERIENNYKRLLPLKRTKRGLFNALGRLEKFIFGTLDDEDEDRFNSQIEDLRINSNSLQKLAENNIGLVNDTLNEIKSRSQTFLKIQKDLNRQLHNVTDFYNLARISSIFDQFLSQYSFLSETVNDLFEVIESAKNNKIHPFLLTSSEIIDQAHSLTLPHNTFFPSNFTFNHLQSFIQHCTIHVHYRFRSILFVINLPLLSDKLYELYQFVPVPHPMKNNFILPVTSKKFLLVDQQYSEYVLTYNNPCTLLWPALYLCSEEEFTITMDSCEIQAFTRTNESACRYLPISPNFNIWTKINTNTWFFASSSPSIANIFTPMSKYNATLPIAGLIEIPPGVTVTTSTSKFIGKSFYNTSTTRRLGYLNFSTPELLPQCDLTVNLTGLDPTSVNVLQQQWNVERQKYIARAENQTSKYRTYTVGVVQLTVIIAVSLYFLQKFCGRRKRRSSNDTNVNLELKVVDTPRHEEVIKHRDPSPLVSTSKGAPTFQLPLKISDP